MPMYVLLSNLTAEGRKALKKNPQRIDEVNRETEAMGVKIKAQYALLGGFDFITLIEARDNQTMARVVTELGSRGTLNMTTLPAIEMPKFLHEIGQLK
jgi:uncharacterized protein with GYD domain